MSITFDKINEGIYYIGLSGYKFDKLGLCCGKEYLGRSVFTLDEKDLLEFDVSIPSIITDEYYLKMRYDKKFNYCTIGKEN